MGFYPSAVGAVLSAAMMLISIINAQQPYLNNYQLACYDHTHDSVTKGFVCNAGSSCQSYITFRSQPPYNSPATVGYLLGATSSVSPIVSLNNISSDVASVPSDSLIVVPVSCSCSGQYYQHNASYTIKVSGETYLSIANDTYQGLTTCSAMMAQNPFDSLHLLVGMNLTVPLRCACPTRNQSSAHGTKYLLTYLVTWGDDVSTIASRFGVSTQEVLDANELSSSSVIYPFTPILVPLTSEPKMTTSVALPPAPSAPPPVEPPPSSKVGLYVGVGVGVAVFLVALLVIYGFYKRRSGKAPPEMVAPIPKKFDVESSSPTYGSTPISSTSWSIKSAIDSLTVYDFEELVAATANFSKDRRIKGASVYRGTFKGNDAAVKIMKGDVSPEITILKKINHSNIIRLSGFCVTGGNTYLVYEFADNGCLYDCLHNTSPDGRAQPLILSWSQRVQIACDIADALNYLHDFTYPSLIHKNLSSRNILLDADFRAKVSNFGLARKLEEGESGAQLHFTKHVVGTQGYMAREYLENGVVTTKLDVFAFGVILAELLSGREAAPGRNGSDDLLSESIARVLDDDDDEDIVRRNFRDFVDPALEEDYPLDLASTMAELAKSCVADDLNKRPSMSQVFMTLNKIRLSSIDLEAHK